MNTHVMNTQEKNSMNTQDQVPVTNMITNMVLGDLRPAIDAIEGSVPIRRANSLLEELLEVARPIIVARDCVVACEELMCDREAFNASWTLNNAAECLLEKMFDCLLEKTFDESMDTVGSRSRFAALNVERKKLLNRSRGETAMCILEATERGRDDTDVHKAFSASWRLEEAAECLLEEMFKESMDTPRSRSRFAALSVGRKKLVITSMEQTAWCIQEATERGRDDDTDDDDTDDVPF